MNTIPGADALGFGFNILGDYDYSSITSQLFIHKNSNASQYTYQPTNLTYAVPDNISVITNTNTTGSTQVFSSRQQFQNYFSAKAKVSGSYAGFSGQFSAAYSQTQQSDKSFYYCLSETEFTGWELLLSSQSSDWLSTAFTEDPIVQNLPSNFSKQNREQFFEMFRKFGTHFISKVTLGGNLYYYVAVEDSFSSNEQQVQVNVSLEYKAVFFSASASAESDWKQLGQNWANSRIVKVDAVGGDTSVLNALDPGYGDSDGNLVTTWAAAVMSNPSVVIFQLTSIAQLFTGDRAAAVSQALEAYMNGAIVANANADFVPARNPQNGWYVTSSSIILNGSIISPDPVVPQPPPTIWHWGNGVNIAVPIGGFQIAFFDPTSFEVLMSHIYFTDNTSLQTEQQVYATMMKDIDAVTQTGYLCVVSVFGMDLMNYPSPAFATWLSTCGAALTDWKKYISFCGSPGLISYVCIGKQGLLPGGATEACSLTTDWADNPWLAGSIDATAEVLLYVDSTMIKDSGHAQSAGFLNTALAQAVKTASYRRYSLFGLKEVV
ncbi:MAG TPA: MAC/perforin domain-containing protein [Chitinophagaceae bacterium]|nr:MAC/perforin domain-containing protein [Chitinophagaceae bacterium]